jgi:predicted DNA-binding transcriptional regulator AlpA
MSNTADAAALDPSYLDRLIDEFEAADFLGYSVRALRNWRVRGGGPRYVKVSARSIRYRRRDLIAWAEARLCSNTSDTPEAFRNAR